MRAQEVVLTTEQDPFYKSNIYSNFGELGVNIKHVRALHALCFCFPLHSTHVTRCDFSLSSQLVDEFQTKTKSNQNIQSIGAYTP